MAWLKGVEAHPESDFHQETLRLGSKRFRRFPNSATKILAMNPSILRVRLEMSWVILYGRPYGTTKEDAQGWAHNSKIDRVRREMLATAVSAANSCRY